MIPKFSDFGLHIECIITNGYVAPDTLLAFEREGFTFLCTVPAKLAHPYALPSDKLTLFAHYVRYPWMEPPKEPINDGGVHTAPGRRNA